MGSISTRDGIRWGCDDLSEPTNTIVVSSPGRYFVDIRILNTAYDPHTFTNGPRQILPLTTSLDWAFGGTSTISPISRPGGREAAVPVDDLGRSSPSQSAEHAVFRHWVDSRTTEPEKVVDEGDMVPLEYEHGHSHASGSGSGSGSGNENENENAAGAPANRTLETGHMVNPATGLDTFYQEVWVDTRPSLRWHVDKVTTLVMRTHDDEKGVRGLWVRLGSKAQGVLRVGEMFVAERWECVGTGTGPSKGEWKCNFTVASDGYKEGEVLGHFDTIALYKWEEQPDLKTKIGGPGGLMWEVVEMETDWTRM